MSGDQHDIRQLASRLQIGQFRSYLLGRGWQEKPSRYVDHIYFEGEVHDGTNPYELYLPESTDVAKYHTRLMRAIYKLCGIEDREPEEIARDVLASVITSERAARQPPGIRLRIRNSGSEPLQIRVDAPLREHSLMPGEAIELIFPVESAGVMEIERNDTSLTILAPRRA